MTTLADTPYRKTVAAAAPFWLSLLIVPLAIISAVYGGWTLLLLPFGVPVIYALIDGIVGADTTNADPSTPESALFWHRLVTLIWPPIQIVTVFAILAYVTSADHLSGLAQWFLFFGLGVMSGAVGINYSHELMHQKPKLERWLADILLGSVMYSHFRSEHLLVHHRYVATPKDPVTARYNENFHYFFHGSYGSALFRHFALKKRC